MATWRTWRGGRPRGAIEGVVDAWWWWLVVDGEWMVDGLWWFMVKDGE